MSADEHVIEPERRTPVVKRVDVLVAGGGPAGFAAAVWAARTGAKTLVIESAGAVGGMATTGMMSHWTGATRGGFYDEILARSADEVPGVWRSVINTERLKGVMLDMLAEAGAGVRLHTLACEPIVEEGAVTGVITESKSGREAFRAAVVVDASGDGDIAARAGVPCRKGRESDGAMQPLTLMFRVGGVDTDRAVFLGGFEDDFETPQGSLQALARRHLPSPAGHVLLYRSSLPGVVTCNMTNATGLDGTKADDLTTAERVCRSQMGPIVGFLRRFVPGHERCYLLEAGAAVGVRETRHIECEYALTDRDILEARVFDDWVVTRAHFNFDVHHLAAAGLDPTGVQKAFPQERGYTIPYRCLVPKGIEGLLMAGRSIGGTHMAHSNFRVMPICANIGQAAGIAAALAVKARVAPRRVPASGIQSVLRAHGVEP